MKDITLLELLKNGVHFGHQTSKWHPRMKQYIFTSRNKVHILDLEQSLAKLKSAQAYLRTVASQGGTFLFVGTKRQAKEYVRKAAESCGAYFVTERWLGGLLTNFGIVSKVMQRLKTLQEDRDGGRWEKYTKKERLGFEEEMGKLEKSVGGMRNMTTLPSVMVIVDLKVEKTAVKEGQKVGLPIVAMVDTNIDPDDATYPIPANDDATKSIELVMNALAEAIQEGMAIRAEQVARDSAPVVQAPVEQQTTIPL